MKLRTASRSNAAKASVRAITSEVNGSSDDEKLLLKDDITRSLLLLEMIFV
jgi:hypothetical protein